MTKYRIAYTKSGRLRFLSHLELTGALIKALRRGALPYKLTEGFNPHPKLTFGPALPVGQASQEEWAEIVLTRKLRAEEVVERLNLHLPLDMKIKYCFQMPDTTRRLSKDLQLARFKIYFYLSSSENKITVINVLHELFKKNSISLTRNNREILITPQESCLNFQVGTFSSGVELEVLLSLDEEKLWQPGEIADILIIKSKIKPEKIIIEKIEHLLQISDNLIPVKLYYIDF